jgi:hypothetical protein
VDSSQIFFLSSSTRSGFLKVSLETPSGGSSPGQLNSPMQLNNPLQATAVIACKLSSQFSILLQGLSSFILSRIFESDLYYKNIFLFQKSFALKLFRVCP